MGFEAVIPFQKLRTLKIKKDSVNLVLRSLLKREDFVVVVVLNYIQRIYLIQRNWQSRMLHKYFLFSTLLLFIVLGGDVQREYFNKFNQKNDHSFLYSFILINFIFLKNHRCSICNQQPIVFCDFHGASLEYCISQSTSLNLAHPLACRIPISSLSGTLSEHFHCPLLILLDSSQEQVG